MNGIYSIAFQDYLTRWNLKEELVIFKSLAISKVAFQALIATF